MKQVRLFKLVRDEDVSGVSGTGIVAYGTEYVSGMVSLSFISPFPHINVYANLHVMEEVHGHDGKTKVVFCDEDMPTG